jgi:hypothetical protein
MLLQVSGWDMISVIFKAGDDLRQEALAMQLCASFLSIFFVETFVHYLPSVLATESFSSLV